MSQTVTQIAAATEPQLPAVRTLEQALLYANAQNLVSRWNNIIIRAKTGREQLAMMRASGVFAENLQLTFDFGEQKLEFNNLVEPEDFYDSFINGLKKSRYNLVSNVEVLEFREGALRFRFKHWMFFGEVLSLVGDNECVLEQDGDRYYISKSYIRAIHFNTQHAYE